MNKKLVKRISSIVLAITVGITPIVFTNSASAAVNIQDLAHQVNIPVNKTWTIKLSKKLHPNLVGNLSYYVKVYSSTEGYLNVGLSYNDSNKAITITPPTGGYRTSTTYSIIVRDELIDNESKYIEAPAVKEFSTVASNDNVSGLGIMTPYSVGTTLDSFVNTQYNSSPKIVRAIYGESANVEKTDISQYMDPNRFKNDKYGIYMFMSLNFEDGIDVNTIKNLLAGKGKLAGLEQTLYNACQLNNVNQAYVVAHALLETGNGTSQLATNAFYTKADGTKVQVYNFFGIGAYDSDPLKYGTEYAYNMGWTTPEKAMAGGIAWIAGQYINSSYKQNTLYKMRWNILYTPHQYATDVAWAYKQISNIKTIMDKCPNATPEFFIPTYN